jgi:hypothetical protein
MVFHALDSAVGRWEPKHICAILQLAQMLLSLTGEIWCAAQMTHLRIRMWLASLLLFSGGVRPVHSTTEHETTEGYCTYSTFFFSLSISQMYGKLARDQNHLHLPLMLTRFHYLADMEGHCHST